MTTQTIRAVGTVIAALDQPKVYHAAKFLSEKLVVKASRRRFHGKIDKRAKFEAVLVIGGPNYREREFIKMCKKAGEPFPVKRVQLRTLK